MNHTSLQSIVTRQPKNLQQAQIRKLFQKHNFPHFELSDLKNKPELIKRQLYNSFLSILEQWNENVDSPDQHISQCLYKRSQFIFSWLKRLAVQNTQYIDSSLIRLKNWYNTSRKKEPSILMHKENQVKAYAQEWEIRNSYRSNLPLQIDNYKRRGLFNIRTIINTPRGSLKYKQNISKENQAEVLKKLQQAKNNKKENAYLCSFREEQEMKQYFNSFSKSKVQFFKNLSKDYYRPQFLRDKLPTPQLKERLNKSGVIKNYRIKTSNQSFRHFSREQNSVYNQTAELNQSINSSFYKSNSYQTCNSSPKRLNNPNTSNIDGLSLLVNPFQSKLKKKKRN